MAFVKLDSLNGLYEINEYGVLKNCTTGNIVKGYKEKNGYQRVRIENKKLGRVIRTSIHQLVAEAFIPNPNNKPFINHIDLNKQNNCVSNLEWVTHSENMKHAYMNGVNTKPLTEHIRDTKKTITNGFEVFPSISNAAECMALQGRCKNKKSGIAGISSVIRHKRNTFAGYSWKEIQDGI